MSQTPLPEPALQRVADCRVEVGSPIDVGETPRGIRRIVPILGGELLGPLLHGQVLPAGADYQTSLDGNLLLIHARYAIETPEGERVYVENTGLRTGPAELLLRLQRGEVVDPALIYFRTTPRFETAAPRLAWLNTNLFLGTGARYADRVELSFFRVL